MIREMYAEIQKQTDKHSVSELCEMRLHLLSEWSEKNFPLTPDTVTFGSNKIVWWERGLRARMADKH